MLKLPFKILKIIQKQQLRVLLFIQIALISAGILEVLTAITIASFLSFMASNESSKITLLIIDILNYNINDTRQVLSSLGMAAIFLVTMALVANVVSSYLLAKFSAAIGISVSNKLLAKYIDRKYAYHRKVNKSEPINILTNQCIRFTNGVLTPMLMLNGKIVVVLIFLIMLTTLNPTATAIGIISYASLYAAIYQTARKRLEYHDLEIIDAQQRRLQIATEIFSSIKEIKVMNGRSYFENSYVTAGEKYSKGLTMNLSIAQIPRFIIEWFTFICLITVGLIYSYNPNFTSSSELIIYAISFMKMLPAMQNCYVHIATIKGNLNSFDNIQHELNQPIITRERIKGSAQFKELELINLNFAIDKLTLFEGLNLKFTAGQILGIVGKSGTGKSTLLEIILGLTNPTSGQVLINTTPRLDDQLLSDRLSIAYVPQEIVLFDASVAENIGFGLNRSDIDEDQLHKVIEAVGLTDTIKNRQMSIWSPVGELGINFSGGQRQRLAIARALFTNPDLLILDEATSALDYATSSLVLTNIKRNHPNLSIIFVTHQLEMISIADHVIDLSPQPKRSQNDNP